jgi:hypothetical protein
VTSADCSSRANAGISSKRPDMRTIKCTML